MNVDIPSCYCGDPAVCRTGSAFCKNPGRDFYTCANKTQVEGTGCKYFQWADGAPPAFKKPNVYTKPEVRDTPKDAPMAPVGFEKLGRPEKRPHPDDDSVSVADMHKRLADARVVSDQTVIVMNHLTVLAQKLEGYLTRFEILAEKWEVQTEQNM